MNFRAALRRFLGGDRLEHEPTLIHVSSAGYNAELAFVGSSPFGAPIDAYSTFLDVPPRETVPNLLTGDSNRYLFRLCGWSIPVGHAARLVGVGEYTEIGYTQAAPEGGSRYPVRRQVVAPGWAFPDGNVSRGITTVNPVQNPSILPFSQVPSASQNVSGITPALLYQDPIIPYTPPAGGRFPGSPLPGLGLWRDGRFRWSFASSPLDYAIEGPCDLVYWASVRQTDPETRPVLSLPPGADLGALEVEDRFVLQFPLSRYTRIGGFMVLEVGPSERFANRRFINPPEAPPCP